MPPGSWGWDASADALFEGDAMTSHRETWLVASIRREDWAGPDHVAGAAHRLPHRPWRLDPTLCCQDVPSASSLRSVAQAL